MEKSYLEMISFDEALKIVLDLTNVLDFEEVYILDAIGRVLGEDIYSDIDIPQFDNSAMDGYALVSDDTKQATKENPKIFKVVEEIPAGYVPTQRITHGKAAKVMTGAIIPEGADCVVMLEDTVQEGDILKVFKEAEKGENIRLRGEDVKSGELVLKSGKILGPAEIGMLAALGIQKIKVKKKPKVGIIATGDELIDLGEEFAPGKVRNVNTYTIYSQVLKYSGIPINLGIVKDTPIEIKSKMEEAIKVHNCDILIISAGVSVGEYDFVKDVLVDFGIDIKFWKVAQRPGKPIVFGIYGKTLIFGLPGYPASSMICFEMYVHPALLKMQGMEPKPRTVFAALKDEIKKKKGLRYFLRVKLNLTESWYEATLAGSQFSGVLKSMVDADGIMMIPEDIEIAKPGERYPVQIYQLNV